MSHPQRKRLEAATPEQIRRIPGCVLIERRGSTGNATPAGDNRTGWELFRLRLHEHTDWGPTRRLVLIGPGEDVAK